MKFKIVTAACILSVLVAVPHGNVHARKKSPGIAAAMSIVMPGAGHFYTQQSGKGLALAGTYLGAMGMVVAYGPWTWEEEKTDPLFPELAEGTGTSGTTKAIWYGSAALAGGVLIYSVIDAASAAKRINEGKLGLAPYFRNGSTGIQLTLRTGF